MNWIKAGEWWYSNEAIGKILNRVQYNVGRELSLKKGVERNLALLVGITYAHLPYDLNPFDMISAVGFDPVEDLAEFGKYYVHEGARLRQKVFFELQNGRRTFAYRYIILMTNLFNYKQFGVTNDETVLVTQISDREFKFSNGKDTIIINLPQDIHIAVSRQEIEQKTSMKGIISLDNVNNAVVISNQIQYAI